MADIGADIGAMATLTSTISPITATIGPITATIGGPITATIGGRIMATMAGITGGRRSDLESVFISASDPASLLSRADKAGLNC
jgi:hypothetical protein